MTMQSKKGFTLIEMLLVLVIAGMIVYTIIGYIQQKTLQMRIDRTTTQMQQILSAGLAYYVANGKWPVTTVGTADTLHLLQGTYLPNVTITSPWNDAYTIYTDAASQQFYVYTSITGSAAASTGAAAAASTGAAADEANVIAGTLPMAYTSSTNGTPPPVGYTCVKANKTCYIVASVNQPGQDLSNVGAINFAGYYKPGACVPVPTCPANTTPQLILTPVEVSGTYDGDSPANNPNVYPLTSFITYNTSPAANPAACNGGPVLACSGGNPGGNYWRVCMQVTTERGEVDNAGWYTYQTIMAATRCQIQNEKTGTPWGQGTNN